MQATLVVAGIAFVGAAIAGGGLVAFKIEVPLIDSLARQIMMAAFGGVLLLVGIISDTGDTSPSTSVASAAELSGQSSTSVDTPPTTRPPDTTAAPQVETTSTIPGPDPGSMRYTTYYWDDGWIEHASWINQDPSVNLQPVLSVFNFSPDYPALTVRLDDLSVGTSTNGFDDGVIPPSWDLVLSPGATAEETGGELVVRIEAGPTPDGWESRADLRPGLLLSDEFDVSVGFFLPSDFYSLDSGGITLWAGEEAGIHILDGLYQSVGAFQTDSNVGAGAWQTTGMSEAWQTEGRLRIVRTAP